MSELVIWAEDMPDLAKVLSTINSRMGFKKEDNYFLDDTARFHYDQEDDIVRITAGGISNSDDEDDDSNSGRVNLVIEFNMFCMTTDDVVDRLKCIFNIDSVDKTKVS